MPELGRYARELRARFWKPPVDDEVRDELAEHLRMLEEDLVEQGVEPAEARRLAEDRFGDAARLGAACRDEGVRRDRERRRSRWWHEVAQDGRYAVRQLAGNRRFALVAILTLGLGLGAATTIFGIANAVLLRPLPFAAPERLVLLDEVNPGGELFSTSGPNFLDWRARLRGVTGLAAFAPRSPSLLGDGAPERLRGTAASSGLFEVLGVQPQLGRTFGAAEDRRGGDVRVAVLSDALWQRRFGADPAVVGRTIDLDGVRRRVVGVLPPGRGFPAETDVWVPLVADPADQRGDRRLEVVGRLAPGVGLEQARQELAAIGARLAGEHPEANAAWTTNARPFVEWYVTPKLRARVRALLATVGLLVLMACVNVASLLLARATTREREMAVRAALGAGRGRIVRQLLTESLLLAALGGLLGVALAAAATPIVRRVGSEVAPRLAGMGLDWRVLGFALAACVATGVVFGLAPAARLLRRARSGGTHALLRTGGRVAGGGRARSALVVASVALATAMLVGAGLVGGSFAKLMRTELGFSPARVLTASLVLPDDGYDYERSAEFFRRLVPRLAALPGVESAGAVNLAPFLGWQTGMDYVPGTAAPTEPRDWRGAGWRAVTPGYFAALRIPLRRGRLLDSTDAWPAPDAMLVNETMARRAWPDADPIGRPVTLANGRTLTVVGVVADSRQFAIDSAPGPVMYFAHAQLPWKQMWLMVRTSAADPAAVLGAVRREVHALDPRLPLARVAPLERFVTDAAAEPRLTTLVFGIFASAALVLAAMGLFGVVSYAVSQRTRELGVRMALGAAPARLAAAVVRQGVRLAAVGVVLGAAAALAAGRALEAILYETAPTDAATYAAVAAMLLVVAAAASLAPARRAARLDPAHTLRSE